MGAQVRNGCLIYLEAASKYTDLHPELTAIEISESAELIYQ
jgi:hypothetical protein